MSKTTRTTPCDVCRGTGDNPYNPGAYCGSCLGMGRVDVQDRPEDDDPEIGGLANG